MRPGEALSIRYGDVERDENGHLYVNLPACGSRYERFKAVA